MKRAIKVLTLTAAATMLFSSTAMALPKNTVVLGNQAFAIDGLFKGVTGIQQALDSADGKLYYNLDGQTSGFVSLFGQHAPITEVQKNELANIIYTDADGNKSTFAHFDDELGIGSVTAVNGTTIRVTFSNKTTQEFSVPPLAAGTNNVSFQYQGKTYSASVSFTPSAVGAAVEKIEFVDYRNIQVTFNQLVNKASAVNPNNYYMEIVDGDAQYGVMSILPTLQDSNQLSQIETTYPGGAPEWWKHHIVAADVNGKTVVNIYLPEDARFTNVVDDELVQDAERTLTIELQTSKPGPITYKLLTKDVTVNVAVRNVTDTAGKMTINTATMPIRILDEVKPELLEVKKVNTPDRQNDETLAYGALGRDLGSFDLFRSDKQQGQSLQFTYSEPVFDAHDLDLSDLETVRDIKLYVNGKEVASLLAGNLDPFMMFQMGADATYAGAKNVVLDAEAAVKAAYKEQFATGIDYRIRFVGVTDLAGNIEVSSEHSFNVRFKDRPVETPVIVSPVVFGIDQVADNLFRIEFNRAGVEATLVIQNPDGEGFGVLNMPVPASAKSANGKYYSYVAVPAKDNEPTAGIPSGIFQNQVLAYDGQDTIYRNVRVQDVVVLHDSISANPLPGDDFIQNQKNLVDDIKSPVVIDPVKSIQYPNRGSSITIDVKDVTPWVADENIHYWVSPIAYQYDPVDMRFQNTILPDQDGADTYLPVKVSYIDPVTGAKHQAMVSNYNLRPYWYWGTEFTDLNPGSEGNITYNYGADQLTLDLSDYEQLLDRHGKLVAGAAYTVEFQPGYFTDSPKDINFEYGPIPLDIQQQQYGYDFWFHGNAYDILNVDAARDKDKYIWWWPIDAGLGFTSTMTTVDVSVDPKPADPDPMQYVPQTSKQLITYDEPTQSIKVEFTGTIDVATLKDKNNYSIDGKTLTQWDNELGTNTVIDYVVNNSNRDDVRQYAVFKVPQDSIVQDGNYAFVVSGVAHPNGGKMTPVSTELSLRDNFRPVVVDAIVTGDRQIKLTFNEPIQYHVDPALKADPFSTARNFLVTIGGTTWTVITAVLPGGPDNDREIILNVGNNIPAGGAITVEVMKDQNNNILVIDKSENKNPMKTTTYNVTR